MRCSLNLLLVWLVAAPPSSAVVVERHQALMGTEVRALAVADSRPVGLRALDGALDTLAQVERLLSTWNEGTALARLNRAPAGIPVSCAPLCELLAHTLAEARQLHRGFDPTVAPLVAAWDLRGDGRIPGDAELAASLSATGPWLFQIDLVSGHLTRRDPNSGFDEGAFGKGWALARAQDMYAGSGLQGLLIDAGGQVLALGNSSAGEGWEVGIAHPEDRGRVVAALRVQDASLATSGSSERFVTPEGHRLSHVLDPRSGRPISTRGSVTVLSSDPVEADILATTLLVVGPEEGAALLLDRPDVGVLFLRSDRSGLHAIANQPMVDALLWIDSPCLLDTSSRPSYIPGSFYEIESQFHMRR